MNTSKDTTEEQDPEYITSEPTDNIQQQLYEEIARKNASDKIKEIIDKEFSKEIDEKEKEILIVQDRLHTALKTLHLLRYVIITDYYNRKQCVIDQDDDQKQTRIHPAIKELLGKTPRNSEKYSFDPSKPSTSKENITFEENLSKNSSEFVGCISENGGIEISDSNSRTSDTIIGNGEVKCGNKQNCEKNEKKYTKRKRKCQNTKYEGNDSSEKQQESREDCRQRLETDESLDGPPKKIPRYIPPKSRLPEPPAPSRGVRHKVRKRIVVGNISKWIPPEWREDAASHKWTMYVRGSKDGESEISEFVSKVRFFLHPSYCPNDVVEVTSPPFYLSRRGWGEFPLRVQLHFKNPTNKPMDIIHHLKLDRTYTGLQTLGSETVVDIWIKNSDFSELKIECDDKNNSNRTDLLDNEEIKKDMKEDNELVWRNSYKNYSHIFMEHDYTKNHFYTDSKGSVENNVTIAHFSQDGESITNSEENGLITNNIDLKNNSTNVENCLKNNINHLDNKIAEEELSLPLKNGLIDCKVKNRISDDVKRDINLQCVLKSLDNNSEVLKPLEIAIPPAFESLKSVREPIKSSTKKIVLFNDSKIISTNYLNTNNSIKPLKSISLLKNPVNNIGNNCKKNSFINININPAKSVLLDTNSYVPALQIAKSMIVNVDNAKINNRKQKIIIGKDKLKILSRKHEFDEAIKEIHDVRIQETEPLMRFILRRIPIVTEDAFDVEYKKLHPFVCKSEKDFLNFPVAKQRALEWFRAKEIQSYLKANISENKILTIKEIILWCRIHGYTPVKSPIINIHLKSSSMSENIESNKKSQTIDFLNTCTESSNLREWIENFKGSKKTITCFDNEIVDIESIDDGNNDTSDKRKIKIEEIGVNNELEIIQVPNTMLPMYSYVSETARKVGVTIGPEEIVPGVSDCTSGRIIMKVLECLMEDLLRLSLARSWERNNGNCPDTITLSDVRKAILSREEFDIFTNSGLGSSTIQYHN